MYRSLPCVILPLLLMTSLVLALVRPQPENISSDNSGFYKIDDLLTSVKNLVIPSTYYRTVNHDDAKMQLTKSAKDFGGKNVGHFSWKTCGGTSDLFQITNLTLSPDPIKLNNPIKVTASGKISLDIGSPIEVDVVVQKKVFVWVTLPCVDDLGSCNYPDLCARLPPPPCPQPLIEANLPCTCPIPAGSYTVNDLEVEFDATKFPGWLTEGDFKAHIVLKKDGKSIACYDLELNIVS